jgi:hypothetical protein
MDFIVGLPHTRAGYDSIWVVVDHLTKAAHFIPVKTTYNSAVLVELYMSRIVCLHGVPKKYDQTEVPNSLLTFGSSCMKLWAHI